MVNKASIVGARQLASDYLSRELELGLEFLPVLRSKPALVPAQACAADATDPRPRLEGAPDKDRLLLEPEVSAASSLLELGTVLGDCQRCKLAGERRSIVFGVGNSDARLMFVGEAPGEDEDLQGLPFVGKAGQLLDKILSAGMGLSREEVYIANVVKCRPPGNRNPQPDEIVACEPFLLKQVELVNPEVIVTLGAFATQVMLRNRVAISKQRGRWQDYHGVALMPTFHPAYLLRSPSEKRVVWGDIKLVMARLGLEQR
ncbi:MAG TPA: uracil-DNA glycosylase [Deltaproteobacteria bacterium]|nr:uracil-DNA glycosylase [Candidatus Binatota bacterium]HIL14330.1 uracil-DNA glycosylase [Deltaproteobacteria bacterium]